METLMNIFVGKIETVKPSESEWGNLPLTSIKELALDPNLPVWAQKGGDTHMYKTHADFMKDVFADVV